MFRTFCFSLVAAAALLDATAAPLLAKSFRFSTDTLAFANETVFQYDGAPAAAFGSEQADAPTYSRRCFVVCRAVEQFRRFARFDPKARPPDDAALARLVRRIARRPVWEPELPASRRVVIPGYPDLRTLSAERSGVLQRNLGLGWPTYVRPGNFCLVFPPSRAKQKTTAAEMDADLARGRPTILWLTEFPDLVNMNHTLFVFGRKARGDGSVAYRVYDPNYADAARELTYDPERGAFSYGKTFYFPGGPVLARAVYRSPWQ